MSLYASALAHLLARCHCRQSKEGEGSVHLLADTAPPDSDKLIRFMFPQGSLYEKIEEQSALARQTGALQPIETDVEFITGSGIEFMIRVARNLTRKDRAKQNKNRPAEQVSPFLKPDPRLMVGAVTDTHFCVLNKYNVVDKHLLIVTKQFELQQQPLNVDDFFALWKCMREFDALAFYNSAPEAGASQSHKHLQVVPLPLSPNGRKLPIEFALQACLEQGVCSSFPFLHKWSSLRESSSDLEARADESLAVYTNLLEAVGCDPQQPAPYNLLATNRWMLIVPRRHECFQSISLNALAFAGSFFVRNRQQLRLIEENGPITALCDVTLEVV